MPNNKNIGVITEQGFAAGEGLGFSPINENELNKKDNIQKDDKNVKSSEDNKAKK